MGVRRLKKDIWPYQVALDLKEWGPTYTPEEWCRDHVGLRFKHWYSYKSEAEHKWVFAFRDEATLLVFLIKWRW